MAEYKILFRGKRDDNGKWVKGIPLYNLYDEIEGIHVPGRTYPNCFTVLPETIGQYTGLVVANGIVFDGDFIKFGDYIYEVFWNSECYQWQAKRVDTDLDIQRSFCVGIRSDWTVTDLGLIDGEIILTGKMTTEIVGNKWDNPELIPQKSKYVGEF